MRNLRTEKEIMARWQSDPSQPLVSICCVTYNHEPYIEDALEGFLIQETDFSFEILIHDDSSTDRTADIIREYEATYPKLIKPIYQVENQYSQGKRPNASFNFPRVKGEYIALCEGDDFWTDQEKLQIQILEMESKNCNISFHPSQLMDCSQDIPAILKDIKFGNFGEQTKIILPKDLFAPNGKLYIFPTASIVFKKKYLDNLIQSEFDFVKEFLIHSMICFLFSVEYGALYIPKTMSVYRKMHQNSWSFSMKKNIDFKIYYAMRLIDGLIESNRITKFYFDKQIKTMINLLTMNLLRKDSLRTERKKEIYLKYKHYLNILNLFEWFSFWRWGLGAYMGFKAIRIRAILRKPN